VAVAIAFFALGLAAGTASLRPVLPAGGAPDERVEIKLDHLRRHGERYDTLFVGSSRTFRGFVPAVFDAATAAAGVPTHSYNLGVPGSRATEVWRLLERVAAVRPTGWRTVFVDPEGFEVLLDEGNHLARSVIDWHDLETTLLVTDYIREQQGGRASTGQKLWMHAVSCAYNLAGVGRALPAVDRALGVRADPEWVAETLGPALDGYAPQDRECKRGFKQDREVFADRVDDLVLQTEAEPGEPAPQALQVFARIEDRIEALGARAVFVAQPGMFVNHDLVAAARAGTIGTRVRLDQPQRFPDLFAFEARYDFNHLNALGAERYTRHLAEAWLALPTGRGGAGAKGSEQ
jgi:hypothetical protein